MTDETLSIARVAEMKAAFTKSDLPFRVEIVDWASTSESFRKVIEKDYVVLVEKENRFVGGEWRDGLTPVSWRVKHLGFQGVRCCLLS